MVFNWTSGDLFFVSHSTLRYVVNWVKFSVFTFHPTLKSHFDTTLSKCLAAVCWHKTMNALEPEPLVFRLNTKTQTMESTILTKLHQWWKGVIFCCFCFVFFSELQCNASAHSIQSSTKWSLENFQIRFNRERYNFSIVFRIWTFQKRNREKKLSTSTLEQFWFIAIVALCRD